MLHGGIASPIVIVIRHGHQDVGISQHFDFSELHFLLSDILGLGGHHFCPAAKERGRPALRAHCREGNDTKVIAQCLCDARHGPQATPLHGG